MKSCRNSFRSFTVHGFTICDICQEATGSGSRTLMHCFTSNTEAKGKSCEQIGILAAFSTLFLLESDTLEPACMLIERTALVAGRLATCLFEDCERIREAALKTRSRFRRRCTAALTAVTASKFGIAGVWHSNVYDGSAGSSARAAHAFIIFSVVIEILIYSLGSIGPSEGEVDFDALSSTPDGVREAVETGEVVNCCECKALIWACSLDISCRMEQIFFQLGSAVVADWGHVDSLWLPSAVWAESRVRMASMNLRFIFRQNWCLLKCNLIRGESS